MIVQGKGQKEEADLFRAGLFMDTTAREVGARIRNGSY
jgi:hypothetical protein